MKNLQYGDSKYTVTLSQFEFSVYNYNQNGFHDFRVVYNSPWYGQGVLSELSILGTL